MDTSHVLYGFTDLKNLDSHGPIVLNKAKGAYVYDTNGKKYFDGNSGLWNSVVGFDHPKMIATAQKQYEELSGYHSLFGRITEPAINLTNKLIEVSPFDEGKVFFTNSGSEANDTAVKLLWFMNSHKGMPKKRKIITRYNSYHGVTVGAASMTGKPYNDVFGLPLPDFIRSACPHYWKFGNEGESEESFSLRMAQDLEDVIEKEGAETIAGFFAEPVMGAGGVIPPSKDYFKLIQPILKKHNIPLIADEVICGFGRTGNLWGCETYNIKPDIIISSKCLTAGYFPMGAVIVSKEFADEFTSISEDAEEFPHGFTAGGHPVGCAIALKAIDVIINEGLLERLQEFNQYEHIGETRGIGLMAALEMVKNKETKEPFEGHLNMGDKVANMSIDNGLICRPLGPAIVLCPQFIINKKQIDEMFDSLHSTLKQAFN